MADAFEKMDRMYRLQRYFYDLTRKYYLLGRDRLLDEMHVSEGESVLEVGCGTARNLIILAKRQPAANLYGLDASSAMLDTAHSKIEGANVKNIQLRTALADDFKFDDTFGLIEPFDKIFFSYSISMIPTWRESIQNALANLESDGTLFIVDFCDQSDLPSTFQKFLKWWLSKFHVHHRPELITYLEGLERNGTATISISPLFRRYAFTAKVQKRTALNI